MHIHAVCCKGLLWWEWALDNTISAVMMISCHWGKKTVLTFSRAFTALTDPTQPELSNIINIDSRYLLPHWICPCKTCIYVILLWHSLYQLAAAHACYLGDGRRKVSSICASNMHRSLVCAHVWIPDGVCRALAAFKICTSSRWHIAANQCNGVRLHGNCKQESAVPRHDAARTAAAERCLHMDRSSLPFQIESRRSAKLQILSHHMVDARHIQTAGNTM